MYTIVQVHLFYTKGLGNHFNKGSYSLSWSSFPIFLISHWSKFRSCVLFLAFLSRESLLASWGREEASQTFPLNVRSSRITRHSWKSKWGWNIRWRDDFCPIVLINIYTSRTAPFLPSRIFVLVWDNFFHHRIFHIIITFHSNQSQSFCYFRWLL